MLSRSPSPVPPVPPPLPAPDYPGSILSASNKMYNWKEVTSDFRGAVKELTLGELLHDDLFGLFEAMSAIEMMDPKMDAGMRCNRQERRPLNFKTAAEEGHLKLMDLSAAEQGRMYWKLQGVKVADQTLIHQGWRSRKDYFLSHRQGES